ncbi:competence/damage-inducible protein A [Paracrocinitomix mangrovi]|uniref:competence/damage-inducible protein A n=1 Tax=Paracrocinitomix mangrovi TaxID=2862509 RepID=UPI001C8E58F8|nr:competence/damage-inducible protein A [Paracrocinitomix mangrovi]UKN01715.1 competence/damage-inducible protein A [Paracrocinitomix mangrovi]
MIAEIITIGDEILVGQTVDTNSAWMARKLKLIGIPIGRIISIADTKKAIVETLDDAMSRADLILITGGLGPTKDDITKHVLTEYFNDELTLYQDISDRIEAYFKSNSRVFLEVNRQQAMLPKNAKIVRNDLGTASGMWFKKDGKDIISMPGVPYEMKGLMEKVILELKEKHQLGDFYHRTVLFQGVPESVLANEIADLENEIRAKKINLSYLPSTGQVKVRLTATSEKEEDIAHYIEEIVSRFPKAFFGYEEDRLEAVIGKILSEQGKTLGTVESCTGGAVAERIVAVSGSSDYYKGSIVSYAYELKEKLVGVSNEDLWKHGAVSEQVITQMAKGGIEKMDVDYCIATSGIAGPTGGTDEKPVGTVWIAIGTRDKVYAKRFNFKQNRKRNIESTVVYALNYLRRVILGLEDEDTKNADI